MDTFNSCLSIRLRFLIDQTSLQYIENYFDLLRLGYGSVRLVSLVFHMATVLRIQICERSSIFWSSILLASSFVNDRDQRTDHKNVIKAIACVTITLAKPLRVYSRGYPQCYQLHV